MIEQDELCNSRSADLVYPRNEQELFLIWSFYERFRGWNSGTELTNFDDWLIRLGLRKQVEGGHVSFSDLDGTSRINSEYGFDLGYMSESYAFPQWLYLFDDSSNETRVVDYPAFCLTNINKKSRLGYLLECLPRTVVNYTMCSIDLQQV